MKIGKLELFYSCLQIKTEQYPHLTRLGILRHTGKNVLSIVLIICIKHKSPGDVEDKNGIVWKGKHKTNYGIQIDWNSFFGFQIEKRNRLYVNIMNKIYIRDLI